MALPKDTNKQRISSFSLPADKNLSSQRFLDMAFCFSASIDFSIAMAGFAMACCGFMPITFLWRWLITCPRPLLTPGLLQSHYPNPVCLLSLFYILVLDFFLSYSTAFPWKHFGRGWCFNYLLFPHLSSSLDGLKPQCKWSSFCLPVHWGQVSGDPEGSCGLTCHQVRKPSPKTHSPCSSGENPHRTTG